MIDIRKYVDKEDAPKGYYAVSKESVRPSGNLLSPNHNENVCHVCDWRLDCDCNICSCMSYKREDGVSVVFKMEVK